MSCDHGEFLFSGGKVCQSLRVILGVDGGHYQVGLLWRRWKCCSACLLVLPWSTAMQIRSSVELKPLDQSCSKCPLLKSRSWSWVWLCFLMSAVPLHTMGKTAGHELEFDCHAPHSHRGRWKVVVCWTCPNLWLGQRLPGLSFFQCPGNVTGKVFSFVRM